jgi:hypothetical protein
VSGVVEIVTAWFVPAVLGVMVNVSGLAERPVIAGTVTVQLTEAAEPAVRVATTLGVVDWPPVIVAVVGLHATE